MAEVETIDTGKLLRETRGQIKYVAEFYHYYAGLADKIEGATLPIDKPDMLVMTMREPIGVVAAIVPWNSQLFLTALKLGPALAAGNAVVIKASEHGPASLLEFAELIERAGIPPGVVSVITGLGDPCGKALTSHPLVARVAFTGGPETARHVVRNAADNFAHVTLELGGKSPIVAFADADLDNTANGVIAGIFGASGQSCVAGSRLIVEDKLCEPLLARIVERAKTIKIGDPLDAATEMGPLCTRGQFDRIQDVVGEDRGRRRPPRPWRRAAGPSEPRLVLRPDRHRVSIGRAAGGRAGVVRSRAVGASLQGRGRGRAPRQRHQLRPRRRHLHQRWRQGSAGDEAPALRHRLDQHLSRGLAHGPVRRLRPERLSAAKAASKAVLDYTRTKSVWINLSSQPMADPFVLR